MSQAHRIKQVIKKTHLKQKVRFQFFLIQFFQNFLICQN